MLQAETEVETKQGALDEQSQEDATKSEETSTEEDSEESKSTEEGSEEDQAGDESEDEGTGDDESKPSDGADVKSQRRLGYQLRQIRQNDPYVATARRNLQGWVEEDGLSDEQREIRGIRADNYIRDLETKRAQLVADNVQVASEFSIFNPQSPDFNKALYDRSLARFGRDSLQLDDNGEIIGYKISLADYMREEADSYLAMSKVDSGKSKTAPKKKAATTDADRARMDAASDAPGGASPTKGESQKDPITDAFLAGFDSVK